MWPRNRIFLEVASMVVIWWILTFLLSAVFLHSVNITDSCFTLRCMAEWLRTQTLVRIWSFHHFFNLVDTIFFYSNLHILTWIGVYGIPPSPWIPLPQHPTPKQYCLWVKLHFNVISVSLFCWAVFLHLITSPWTTNIKRIGSTPVKRAAHMLMYTNSSPLIVDHHEELIYGRPRPINLEAM